MKTRLACMPCWVVSILRLKLSYAESRSGKHSTLTTRTEVLPSLRSCDAAYCCSVHAQADQVAVHSACCAVVFFVVLCLAHALAFLCLPAAVKAHFLFFPLIPFSLVHLSSFSFFRAPGGFRFLLLLHCGACFFALRFLLPAYLAGAQGNDLQGVHGLSLSLSFASFVFFIRSW
jgi:hypothetical protein